MEAAGPQRRPRRPNRSPGARRDAETQVIHEAQLARAREDGLAPEDEAAFLQELDARLTLGRSWLEEQKELQGEYGPTALLEAVAGHGGIGYNPNWDEAGEIAWFWGRQDKAKLKGASRTIRGVKRVFVNGHDSGPDAHRKWGLRLDEMALRLRQDPRFENIDGPDALITALTKAANPNLDNAPGTLEEASQIDQRRWWREPLGYAPAQEDPIPRRPLSEYSDEELRQVYDPYAKMTPDETWAQEDADEWHAVMAEGTRRGWDDDNNPPPGGEPAVAEPEPPPPAEAPPTNPAKRPTAAKQAAKAEAAPPAETASPEEAKAILAAAGEQLKQQPQFDMPPLTLTGEVSPSAAATPGLFEPSPQSQEKIDAIRQEREALYKKLGKEFDTLTMGPFNPEVAKIAVQLMRNYAQEGYVRFSDVVGRLVHDIGSAKVQVLADYLNTAWNIVHKEKEIGRAHV